MQKLYLSFSFLMVCMTLAVGNLQAQNYFALANACIDSASVEVAFTGETEISTCNGDGVMDRIRFRTSSLHMAFGYVVVDANDIIVSIGFSNFIDFEMLPAGTLRVYAFSNLGLITASVGETFSDAQLSVPCFGLTTNFVLVNNNAPFSGATITTADGATEISTCPGDGVDDVFSFTIDTDNNVVYVFTDSDGIVLGVSPDGSFNFEDAGEGVGRVYAVTTSVGTTIMIGDNFNDIEFSSCEGQSDNFVTVNRATAEGGTIATEDGENVVFTCPGDGIDDLIRVDSAGAGGLNYTYIVTDGNGIVLSVPAGDVVNVEGAGEGNCRIYGLAYAGDLLVTAGDTLTLVDLASGCFDLTDNFVETIREVPNAGTIATEDGETEVLTCPGDGVADLISVDSTAVVGQFFTYVVTDGNNVVLGIPGGDVVDVEDAGEGNCRIWGIAYQGDLTVMVGDTLAPDDSFATGCSDLSDNFVETIRLVPDAGTVSTEDGENELNTCPGDGLADLINLDSLGGNSGGTFTYVVTDSDGIVLGIPAGDVVDVEGAGVGTCLIYGLVYQGDLLLSIGDDIATADVATSCFDFSDNTVTVTRQSPPGGTVSLEGGGTEVTFCSGVDQDTVRVDSIGAGGDSFTYILTNENGLVIGVDAVDLISVSGLGTGVIRIYGLAYTGDLVIMAGDILGEGDLSTGCAGLSENFVSIFRVEPDGGTVTTTDGETEIFTCPGDGQPDNVSFDTTGTVGQFTFVVTDSADVILTIPEGNTVNFEGSGIGNCHVWGVSYLGNLTLEVGDTLTAVDASDECFDLSDNFVNVIRQRPDGGTVSLEGGGTSVTLCPGDELSDVLTFDSTGTFGPSFTYIITDADNMILAIPGSDSADLAPAGLGVCRVWGLAYTGDLVAETGDVLNTVSLSDDCFDLSDNFITVNRIEADGGTVSTPSGQTEIFTCPGDGVADLISVDSTGVSAPLYTYVVTDENNVILGVPGGDVVDVEDAGEGNCRIWGLAYAGELLVGVDDTIQPGTALATGCFDLSDNFINVIRQTPEGGLVSIQGTGGQTTFFACPGDGIPDLIRLDSIGSAGQRYTYVVTNNQGIVIGVPSGDQINTDIFGTGTFRIYGLAFQGTRLLGNGDDVTANPALATGCGDLSSNFITVVRQIPNGGTVSTEDGETEVSICVNDDVADVVMFDSTGVSQSLFTYVITDTNNVILGLPVGDELDFENSGLGICRVWGLAYTGNITAMVGDTATSVALSDGCFDLSDNFITVNRGNGIAGSTVSTEDGMTMVATCPGDGVADIIRFDSITTGISQFTYVVTDSNNVILGVPPGDAVDFEDAGTGTCRVWGLTYTGDVLAMIGDTATAVDLASGCFSLSDNFVEVIRIVPEAGTLSSTLGDTINICAGDGMGAMNTFEFLDAQGGNFALLVVQDSFLAGVFTDPNFDFENAVSGTYQVYGVAYAGTLNIIPGDNIFGGNLSTSCNDLTSNFITVNVSQVDGGTITSNQGAGNVFICPSNLTAGTLTFSNDGDADIDDYVYVATVGDGLVLQVLTGNSFNFIGLPVPSVTIYGVSYTGTLNLSVGTMLLTAQLSDECFDISENGITVFVDEPESGEISRTDEETEDLFCILNGDTDLEITTSSTSQAGYAYIVTDENDIVVSVSTSGAADFNGLAAGPYRVYGLSYTGQLLVVVGTNLELDALATSCAELTDSFIQVERGAQLNGGTLSTMDGLDTFYVCPMDGQPDLLVVNNAGATTGVPYNYVVTDVAGNILVPAISNNVINFDVATPGVCRVYGFSYTGDILAFFGQNINNVELSDSCAALSLNFITVIRYTPEGGSVTTEDGETEVTLDLSTDEDATLTFANSGQEDLPYAYVVTDLDNVILSITTDDEVNFNNAGAGVCRVWGVSYVGDLNMVIGQQADTVMFSDDCNDLSDDFVLVTRIESDGLSTPASDQLNQMVDALPEQAILLESYPNPSTGGQMNVELSSQTTGVLAAGTVSIIDINGNVWHTESLPGGTGTQQMTFDVNSLPAGLYTLFYQGGGEQQALRFVRQ